ncbi:MAG: hypothetical protein K6A38_01040 [Lachnospiraceae bacterium]|nr:hypothetical protein [Lachnospiraceae bacterium]
MLIRRILKDTCLLSSLMIIAVFTFSIIWSGITAEIALVFLLFGLAFIITVVNYLLDEYMMLSIIAGYIVKYFVFSGVVMLFGFIAGWFYSSNFWMAFIYVGVVLVLTFVLDVFKVHRDIEYINEHLAKY